MAYYRTLGQLPSKRHIQFRGPDGRLYAEEVFGTEGFVGPTSTMYHIHAPTQVMGWETLYSTKPEYVEMDTMRMRHVKSMPLPPQGGSHHRPRGALWQRRLRNERMCSRRRDELPLQQRHG